MSDQRSKDSSSSAKGYKVWEPLLLSLMVVLGMFVGQKMGNNNSSTPILGINSKNSDSGERIEELIHFIEERYVDDIDAEALVEKAIEAVIEELDPHSSYLSPEVARELEKKMQGKFEGIGIEFFTKEDTLVLSYIMEHGPALKAGLKVGDRLIQANEELLTGGRTEKDLYQALKDVKGTKVDLKVLRPHHGLLDFKIIRDEIPINSVAAYEMLDEETGYIRIERFSSTTYQEFMDAIEAMIDQEGMQHLVIDLRKNPGGYLQQAVNMLSQLFEERNKLLLYTEGTNSKRTEYKTTGNQFFKVDKIAVLIDKNSASASEIMAGAIQDHDRGVIIGEASYGKGLVQEQYPLTDGASLRLTIARYYTPSGRLIQRPYDSENDPGHEEYYTHSDSISEDTTHYYTDKGRLVFAKGGVSPDIVMTPLLDYSDPRFDHLYSYLTAYATKMIVDMPSSIQTSGQYQTYLDTMDLQTDFLAFAAENPKSENALLNISPELANEVNLQSICKATIISHQFGYDHWYKILNDVDPIPQKALEILRSEKRYSEHLD